MTHQNVYKPLGGTTPKEKQRSSDQGHDRQPICGTAQDGGFPPQKPNRCVGGVKLGLKLI